MAEQVDWFNAQGGLPWCVRRTAESSATLYGWAEAIALRDAVRHATRHCARRSSAPSTSTTAIDAAAVAKVLRANGIVDTEPYRKLGRNQLRIAMFPAIDADDVDALTACIDHVVDALS